MEALDYCDIRVLVLPYGRSVHLEAGYSAGRGKQVIIYLHPDEFKPELMYQLGHGFVNSIPGLLRFLATDNDDGALTGKVYHK